MISYELAKKLKDAGFPQPIGTRFLALTPEDKIVPRMKTLEDNFAFAPSLSEIIEACGYDFVSLTQIGTKQWEAKSLMKPFKITEGSTPEEAVANLWLALNEKK